MRLAFVLTMLLLGGCMKPHDGIRTILERDDQRPAWQILGDVEVVLFRKVEEGRDLSETEALVLGAQGFQREIHNGGLEQYFYNSASDHYDATIAGLRTLGLVDCAAFIERAGSLFPGGRVPQDRVQRIAALEQITDAQKAAVWETMEAAYFKSPCAFEESLLKYLREIYLME